MARLIVALAADLSIPGGGTVVPVVNMADDPALVGVARAIAEQALAAGVRAPRVVLTSLTAADPVVGVVARP